MCFTGRSGNAKTGAMYAGLSVYGNPKDLSVFEATENALTQRYLGLHNLMFGLNNNVFHSSMQKMLPRYIRIHST